MRLSRLLPATLLASSFLAPRLDATWSIIIVDTRTGEVAIGSATCVPGYDLRQLASVVVVGKGAAAAQSYVQFSGTNRQLIFSGFKKGTDPKAMLAALAKQDGGHQTRQYGIVDTKGRAIGFSGTGAGAYAGHLTGRIGDIVYAIQGNVITGRPVLTEAEKVIRASKADLMERLMLSMEAARKMGGDGRCSCSQSRPTACGSPPRNAFTHSAYIGYMLVARIGDKDGGCDGQRGCATGTYFMRLDVANTNRNHPDPVLTLRKMYDAWRKTKQGRPDHHRSEVRFWPPSLPNDGKTQTTVAVKLVDVDGKDVGGSSAKLSVTLDPTSSATVQIGKVTARGGGVYTFPVTAGSKKGAAQLRIEVDDGKGKVLVGPVAPITVVDDSLWNSSPYLSASAGGRVDFVLRGGAVRAKTIYGLMVSASGTSPGIKLRNGARLPLNLDPVLQLFLSVANTPVFARAIGTLDASSRAEAQFRMPPGLLTPVQGRTLNFAWASFPNLDFASNASAVRVGR